MISPDVARKCVVFRNGIEIWIPEGEKLERFQTLLTNLQSHMFVSWEGRNMNTADITGIFKPEDMEAMKRQKKGEWQCKYGTWHDKNSECECRSTQQEMWKPPVDEISEEQRQSNIAALAKLKEQIGKKL